MWLLTGCLILNCQPSIQPSQTTSSQEEMVSRPNVVWIMLDAARAHNFSCYGYDRPTTPNMDRLAQDGVLFLQNFTQAHVTIQSVPSFMSGRYFPVYCHEPGKKRENVTRQRAQGEYLLPEIMRENGYHTTFLTTHGWFNEWSPLAQAFDEFIRLRPSGRSQERGLSYAPFEEINRTIFPWLDKHPDRPFFLYIHSLDTHTPYDILDSPQSQWVFSRYEQKFQERFQAVQNGGRRFTMDDREHLRGRYDANLWYADTQLGAFLNKLKKLKLLKNTIIIISSDHGEMLGEDGKTASHSAHRVYDYTMHVPLVMTGPGLPSGPRILSLTENVDIVPTLIDLLDLKTDAQTDGKSLMPTIWNPGAPPVHRYVFTKRVTGRNYEGPLRYTLRSKEYKYEYFSKLKQERLWKVPDKEEFPPRDLIHEKPEIAAEMRQYLFEEIMPLHEAYMSLPTTTIHLSVRASDGKAKPDGAYLDEQSRKGITEDNRRDNKWAFCYSTKYLCASPEEDAPPLSLQFEVPDGRYQVEMFVAADDSWRLGRPASSFLVQVEDETDFRKVTKVQLHESIDSGSQQWQFIDLGVYTIDDGTFDITLDEGEPDHWAVVRRFSLTPVTSEETEEERDERLQQLRDLGYL